MDYKIKGETLTEIADAIRDKTGSTEAIKPEEMANGVENVYEAGKGFGTTKTVTGNPVRLDYIHPIEHEINVQLTSDTITDFSDITVTQYGKNLLPYPFAETTLTREGITYTDNGDGSITLNGTATANKSYFILQRNAHYGENMMASTSNNGTNGEFAVSNRLYYGPSDKMLCISIPAGTTFVNETIYPQVEYGSAPTAYERYIQPTEYTANADGIVQGIKSISPTMTLKTNSAVITAEYYVADGYFYNCFWDEYQNYGNRINYELAFGGQYWNDERLKEMKYPLISKLDYITSYMMFARSQIVDLTSCLKDKKLVLAGPQYAFANCLLLEHIGKLELSNWVGSVFASCPLLSVIDELKIDTSSGTTPFETVPNLTYIKWTGENCIGVSINLSSATKETTITIPEDVYDNDGNLVYATGEEVTETGVLYYPTISTLIPALKTGANKTLTLGEKNINKLIQTETQNDLATITGKGWTVL